MAVNEAKNMNIKEIREAKSKLEDSIRKQLDQFFEETSIVVTDIGLEYIEQSKLDKETIYINYMVYVSAQV